MEDNLFGLNIPFKWNVDVSGCLKEKGGKEENRDLSFWAIRSAIECVKWSTEQVYLKMKGGCNSSLTSTAEMKSWQIPPLVQQMKCVC